MSMANQHLMRAEAYMEREQYPEAAAELTSALGADPENGVVLAMLADCQDRMGNSKDAIENARKALGFDPESSIVRAIYCGLLINSGKAKEAEKIAMDGLLLDSEDADLHYMRGLALFNMRRVKEALVCAKLALEMNAGHEGALWLNTQAKSVLRHKDAVSASMGHLAQNPEGIAMKSHAFMLLRQGKTKEAYETFLQALKNDPTDDGARDGLKEAIRGKFFLYRLLQTYSAWVQSFGQYWWIPLILVMGGRRVFSSLAESNPQLRPFLIPVAVFLAFLIWGWVVLLPVMNALMLLHPYGKHALHPSEKWEGRYWMVAVSALLIAGVMLLPGMTSAATAWAVYGTVLWVAVGLASLSDDEKRRIYWVHSLASLVNIGGLIYVISLFFRSNGMA